METMRFEGGRISGLLSKYSHLGVHLEGTFMDCGSLGWCYDLWVINPDGMRLGWIKWQPEDSKDELTELQAIKRLDDDMMDLLVNRAISESCD
ncbi:MAG: hypothetical protein LBS17_02615 [Actinomycetes bacterium]|jgi:hypothetical protein|nr:hypothetical protein [Actinomycetes bacterium]